MKASILFIFFKLLPQIFETVGVAMLKTGKAAADEESKRLNQSGGIGGQ